MAEGAYQYAFGKPYHDPLKGESEPEISLDKILYG
jgi:hypothetical protein